MKKSLSFIFLLSLLSLAACKKETSLSDTAGVDMDAITVPSNFDWSTTKKVKFTIGITDKRFGEGTYSIYIYDADPAKGGQVLASGSATLVKSFVENITIPAALSTVYIEKTAPDGSVVGATVSVAASTVSASFGENSSSAAISAVRKTSLAVTSTISTECPSGSTTYNSGSYSWFSVNQGESACIYGNVSLQGISVYGTVRIYGTVTASNISIYGTGKVYIMSGASYTGQIDEQEAAAYFENNGTLRIGTSSAPGYCSINGKFYNNGTMTASGLSVNSNNNNGQLVNGENGTISITENMAVNTLNNENHHSITVGGSLFMNTGSGLSNSCKLIIGKDLGFSSRSGLNNSGYIKVSGTTGLNDNVQFKMNGGSMLTTSQIGFNSTIQGDGQPSLIKVTDGISYKNVSTTTTSGVILLDLKTNPKASANIYIPTTTCNPEGYGVAPEYYTYSPNYNNGGSTLIFEDKWPSKGDFDMNDIVISYKYKIVKNADNKATRIEASYTLLASGGDYQNGFGVQFPVDYTNVTISNITSTAPAATTKLENSNGKAVVILFDNVRSEQANWNTVLGDPTSPKVTYTFVLNLKTPVEMDQGSNGGLGNGPYNPFIFNSVSGSQRNEIHLPDMPGTAFAKTILSSGENSATRYYVTKDNLPWAMEIPLTSFKYPLERQSISFAYPSIKNWAESGGSGDLKWYSTGVSSLCYPVSQ